MLTNQPLYSLSPPSTPPQRILQQQQQQQLPQQADEVLLPISRPASACPASSALTPLLARSSSLHSPAARSNHHFFSSSSSNTISRSTSTLSSNSSNSFSFPPTPPQSHHGTPLAERVRSISSLSQADRPTPPRSSSRNDIFALSLPQPSLPITANCLKLDHQPHQSISNTHHPSSYDQQHLIRLKTSLHLRINTSPASILGEGTHGTVHIALCNLPSADQPKPWKLCAAKLSQDLAGSIKETLVLERLRARREEHHPGTQPENGSRFIVGWFGLKDHKECDWIRSPEENPRQPKRSLSQTFLPPIILALEYCPAGDLFNFVQRAAHLRSQDHPQLKSLEIASRRWLRWSKELAEALAWCKQRNVLLGDLKPHNVLLTAHLRIKLSDFNRSTILSEEQAKAGLGLIDPQGTGTSVYAAPELVQPPPSPSSFPADIFALGITMCFLLTGREPYRGIQSPVERMLLISRGAFWEHELGMRWRMLEDIQSAARTSSSKYPRTLSSSTSTEPLQSQPLLVSQNTIDALYGLMPDLESNHPDATLEDEENYPPRDHQSRIGFYSDGSPKLRYLNGNEIVDEQVMKLISKMCSPAAVDRPQIDQVIQQLNSI